MADEVTFSLDVYGIKNPPEPKMPFLADFMVLYSNTEKRVKIVEGEYTIYTVFYFELTPLKEGLLTIGPASFEYEGKKYKSRPLEVIVEASSWLYEKDGEQPSHDIEGHELFVELSVDKNEVYLHEQVTLIFRFFHHRGQVEKIQYLPPGTRDFMKKELVKERHFKEEKEGSWYTVTELKEALFPIRTGKIIITPAIIQCYQTYKENGSYVIKKRELRSKEIEIKVKLPPFLEQPVNFKGAIGSFDFSVAAWPRVLKVFEPVNIEMKLSGFGNIESINMPQFALSKDFKVYEKSNEIESASMGDKFYGEKVFRTVLIPQKPGKQFLPEISFSFFNPEENCYREIKPEPIAIEVAVLSREEQKFKERENIVKPDIGKKIQIYSRDINFIKEEIEVYPSIERIFYKAGSFCLINGGALIFLLGLYFYQRRKEKLKINNKAFRCKDAYKKFKKRMLTLRKLLERGELKFFYINLNEIMQEYLADKFNVSKVGLNKVSINEMLKNENIPGEILAKVKDYFELCEGVIFAEDEISGEDSIQLFEDVEKIFKELEKIYK